MLDILLIMIMFSLTEQRVAAAHQFYDLKIVLFARSSISARCVWGNIAAGLIDISTADSALLPN